MHIKKNLKSNLLMWHKYVDWDAIWFVTLFG